MVCKIFKTLRNQKIRICIDEEGYSIEQVLKKGGIIPGLIFKSFLGGYLMFNRYGYRMYPFDEKTSREIEKFVFGEMKKLKKMKNKNQMEVRK